MNEPRIIAGSLVGTTAMTAFSYIVSAIENSNFKEPNLLAKLLHRLFPQTDKTLTKFAGWQLHYAVGLVFVIVYSSLWKRSRPSFMLGVLLGGISGVIGILGWKLTFKLHPHPPLTNFKKYYLQLLATHIIFALFSTIGYNTCNPTGTKKKDQ